MASKPSVAAVAGRVVRGGASGGVVRRRGGVQGERSRLGGVSQMQRARLLSAAVPVVDELGWSGVTVADIAARARVSRRTFYDLFANREECLLAVLHDAVGRVERDLAGACLQDVSWVESVRTGLWRVLCFLDHDPVLARVCVVQSARGSRRVLEARERILARLAHALQEGGGSQSARGVQALALTAEGLVGAVVAIVYKRLLVGERSPLTDLHGELMGMIVLPYLGAAAASRERKRRAPRLTPSVILGASRLGGVRQEDPLRDVPMRLTYRTARVLQAAAEYPGASNRRLGEQADLHDQGQISKLLSRLQRLGLLVNSGPGQPRGESNAWKLTQLGERVTEQLSLAPQQHGATNTENITHANQRARYEK
jgi:AcrR family transcriptional regulator